MSFSHVLLFFVQFLSKIISSMDQKHNIHDFRQLHLIGISIASSFKDWMPKASIETTTTVSRREGDESQMSAPCARPFPR